MRGLQGRRLCLAALIAAASAFALTPSAGAAPGDATASLVANLNALGNGDPANLFNANGTLFFSGFDGTTGTELWKSNGGPLGPGGTEMVANINPGSGDSNPGEFARIGDTVFFSASDGCCSSGQHGTELWKINPPYTTPTMVEDINQDPDGSATADSFPQELTNINGTLLFQADDGNDGEELWKVEGPNYNDAVEVANINTIPGNPSFPQELTAVNGILFFVADNGGGDELWKSVSPFTSASMVKDIDPGTTAVPAHLTDVNGTLLFAADDGIDGVELWKSSGPGYNGSSTVMVDDINVTAGADSDPDHLTNVGGRLFFSAHDAGADFELYRSVPPFSSTTKINVNPGGSSDPSGLVDVGGELLFGATDGVHSAELWKSNGGAVASGTELVADINPTAGSFPSGLTTVAGQVFFQANNGIADQELWKSASPFTSATRVADIRPGSAASDPAFLTDVNGTLFFRANDGTNGRELWKATIEPTPPPPTVNPPAPAPSVATATKKKCKKKHGKKSAAASKKKSCKKKKK
jgi:ELWxxDGT repeat protein